MALPGREPPCQHHIPLSPHGALTTHKATDDEHANGLGGTGDDGPNNEDDARDHDGLATANLVGNVARRNGAQEGATGHGRRHTALEVRREAGAGEEAVVLCCNLRVTKVDLVVFRRQNGRHGGDCAGSSGQ